MQKGETCIHKAYSHFVNRRLWRSSSEHEKLRSMGFPTFALGKRERKFSPDPRVGEKEFGWGKIFVIVVVTAVGVLSTGLLFAALLLGSSSMNNVLSSEGEGVDAIIPPSILNFGKNTSEAAISIIRQQVLPMSQIYCSIRSCVVTCSGIPAASNPGIIAAVFVDSEYGTQCPGEELIEELIFDRCRFPKHKLSAGWLPTNFQLNKLTLKRCALRFIESDALNSRQFTRLKSLVLIENAISILEKSLFDTLSNLEELVITDNVIRVAEADLLVGTANTLQVLQIDKAIYTENILGKIVGSSALPRVVLLSLRENFLQIITRDAFRGVPNVQSVCLTNSGISSIEPNAFDHFSGSIRQLFLSGNSLSRLPSNTFRSLIQSNRNLKVTLADNEWNCDCDLEWLKNYNNIFADEPRCATPESNAMLNFSTANFCQSESTDELEVTNKPLSTKFETTQSVNQEDGKTEADEDLFTLTCEEVEETSTNFGRKLLSTKEMKLHSKFEGFFIREEENGSIYVSLPATQSAYTVIWFNYIDLKSINESVNLRNIGCLTNVKKSMHLTQLMSGISYTICLLETFDDLLKSPFNCLAIKRALFDYEKIVWLESKDKPVFFSSLAVLLILVSAMSMTGAYFVVWKNPKLLRGSKRIIIVRHRAADAIVLPEGLRLKSDKEEPRQREYVTPMSQRRLLARKTSVISGASSRRSSSSYVSGIQPTTTQLISWRIGRIREILSWSYPETCDSTTPPVPPPRIGSIPSLSYNVDEKRSSKDYRNPGASTFVNFDDNHQQIGLSE